ncbi:hypothetical protein CSPHI_03765 [Corynebacterium sphenisci DSM 44792]|uniref:PNPLA domain-containing protein n=1 Tax=Corynebacterium sphenisci DSM 44792 TaxID=1437874 RepID=A0A1L7CWS4_9CORY|nr:patatin family protein [Corynebacterium sphenisci]APT90326.1 hypothetical protein CSPHI_03765 [Corynebacterium sphenisci DSM 44792]
MSNRHFLPDVALVLEGGGMRAAYTSACVDRLIAEGLDFGWVGGISAGASLSVNYLSRDRPRTRESFVDMSADGRYGGWGTWLRGRGFFDSEFIYETAPLPDGPAPYDFEAFLAHPARLRIPAVREDTGEQVVWGREDISGMGDLMRRVRATSTMPWFMVPPEIDGVRYVDGALGPSGGIPLDLAEADGFRRFLVLSTRTRDYRKEEVTRPNLLRRAFPRTPAVAEALIARPARYNAMKDRLLELEREGRAMLFFPEEMDLSNRERRVPRLRAAFAAGAAQTERELPAWREFLGLDGA